MARPNKKPPGQIRQSQLVTTFGPGSMVDLPNYSVIVSGLDDWSQGGEEIDEPRLVDKIQRLLSRTDVKLRTPPPEEDDPTRPQTGITAWQFPEWFVTQDAEQDEGEEESGRRTRLLVQRQALDRGRFYRDRDKKRRPVVPVRFVRACRRGHIGDIDWYSFCHGGHTDCRRQLFMDELGTTGDIADIQIRCACKKTRPMTEAFVGPGTIGFCNGNRPWLGAFAREDCGEPNRLLVRTASNAYFSQLMSVITIPDRNESLAEAVNGVWEHHLQYVEDLEDLKRERSKKPPVRDALEGFSDEDVMNELQRRRGGATVPDKKVKEAEFETLTLSQDEIGEDKPDGDFYARTLPRDEWVAPWMSGVERVVLVHRLREVTAQVGFTRFESSAPDVEGELDVGVQRASLAREVPWLPAVENRGEGFFLAFARDAITSWATRPEVRARAEALLQGFEQWKGEHQQSRREFAGLPYLMLHSLSHLLISAVSLECGYPSSAIRERVYAGEWGYGILLFTGSPDVEGTLGGLVQVGRDVRRHLAAALELGRLCSNDPVCAQHDPKNQYEQRFLHGAACHGCVLIAEPSCEMRNDFLDRALVVPTVENLGAEFFRDEP